MAPRSSHGPAAAGCIAGSESLFGRAPPALSLRRRFRFQGDVSCACFSPPPLRTPRRNASRRLDAATMLRGDVFKRPCYGLRLFHLHSAVKIQPFSPVFLLAEYRAKAFCRLSLWNFKEKSINHFLGHGLSKIPSDFFFSGPFIISGQKTRRSRKKAFSSRDGNPCQTKRFLLWMTTCKICRKLMWPGGCLMETMENHGMDAEFNF